MYQGVNVASHKQSGNICRTCLSRIFHAAADSDNGSNDNDDSSTFITLSSMHCQVCVARVLRRQAGLS